MKTCLTRIAAFGLFLLPTVGITQENDAFVCLDEPQPFYATLQQRAYEALDRRLEVINALLSPEEIRKYQARQREFFLDQLGGLPEEKSPLNAVTVRTIEEDGYQIENVIFDSRPRHRITANFYLPEGDGPFPGIVIASGHSRTAKTAEYNQRYALMMVRCGMAALCFDPIGQGERSQVLNDEGRNRFPGTTTEHLLVGVGSMLVGRNTATYEVWDAMRSIDYLVSRPEVDPERIGMTGCSGGGTQTSYAMALDDRIRCAAPSCYVTTFRRLVETIGPQDAEQNIFAQLNHGLDHPDYLIMRAPKPTLISATNGDYFPIDGSWLALRQAKQIFGRLGFPERVDLVEGDGEHGVPPQNLASIGHWMQRWLLERDEPVPAIEIAHRPLEELHCTGSGQVLAEDGELSVFDLNAAKDRELGKQRKTLWQESDPATMRQQIREKIGLHEKRGKPVSPAVESVEAGIPRDEYVIEKRVVRSGPDTVLPTLVFRPQNPDGTVCLYLHPEGKSADATPGGKIEQLVKSGKTVVAVDLSGQGETSKFERTDLHGDWKTASLAYLLGQSLVGIRTGDTLAVARIASDLVEENIGLELIGAGEAGIIALHAAALEPDLFQSVRLFDSPESWAKLVPQPVPGIGLDYSVHGALELYDLPDLVSLIGNERVNQK